MPNEQTNSQSSNMSLVVGIGIGGLLLLTGGGLFVAGGVIVAGEAGAASTAAVAFATECLANTVLAGASAKATMAVGAVCMGTGGVIMAQSNNISTMSSNSNHIVERFHELERESNEVNRSRDALESQLRQQGELIEELDARIRRMSSSDTTEHITVNTFHRSM